MPASKRKSNTRVKDKPPEDTPEEDTKSNPSPGRKEHQKKRLKRRVSSDDEKEVEIVKVKLPTPQKVPKITKKSGKRLKKMNDSESEESYKDEDSDESMEIDDEILKEDTEVRKTISKIEEKKKPQTVQIGKKRGINEIEKDESASSEVLPKSTKRGQ